MIVGITEDRTDNPAQLVVDLSSRRNAFPFPDAQWEEAPIGPSATRIWSTSGLMSSQSHAEASMTVPIDYKQATANFDRFMVDLREELDLQTTHQAWGVLLGVLDTFRRRLDNEQALDFAKALPPLLRAVFVQDWHFRSDQPPFAHRATLDQEVMAYHRDHQLAQLGCIAATARSVRRHVDEQRFDASLNRMPEGARDFWSN